MGAKIRAIGPCPLSDLGCARTWIIIGQTKAKVFPLPVLAIPTISLPEKAQGSAWAWIGVGVSYFSYWRTLMIRWVRGRWPKLATGLGIGWAPLILI